MICSVFKCVLRFYLNNWFNYWDTLSFIFALGWVESSIKSPIICLSYSVNGGLD
jgi:hypothetical protein